VSRSNRLCGVTKAFPAFFTVTAPIRTCPLDGTGPREKKRSTQWRRTAAYRRGSVTALRTLPSTCVVNLSGCPGGAISNRTFIVVGLVNA